MDLVKRFIYFLDWNNEIHLTSRELCFFTQYFSELTIFITAINFIHFVWISVGISALVERKLIIIRIINKYSCQYNTLGLKILHLYYDSLKLSQHGVYVYGVTVYTS